MNKVVLLIAIFMLSLFPGLSVPAGAQTAAQQRKEQNVNATKKAQQQRAQPQQRATQQRAQQQRATQQKKTDQQKAQQQKAQQQKAVQQRQERVDKQKALQQRKAEQQREAVQKRQEKSQEDKTRQLKAQQDRREAVQQQKARQQQQRVQERERQQQQLQQRQQAQKAQRERAARQKVVAQQRAQQRQSASRQRAQQKARHAQQRKIESARRADQRRRELVQNRQRYIDRRLRWRERPRITRNRVVAVRFVRGFRYGGGWYARRAIWSPWRAWRFGYVAAFIPWGGPVFWPYVYDDVFTYTFWPNAYDPGFWGYAYDDLIDSAFYPAGVSYAEELEVAPAPAKALGATTPPRQRAPATLRAEQVCGSGITSWPIEKIERAVQPTAEQQELLDALRESTKDAAALLKDACPTTTAGTPPERMLATVERLETTLEAVKIVRPTLVDFYMSLNDVQKSKFDAAMAPKITPQSSAQESPQARCSDAKADLATFPIQQMEEVLKPNEDQQFLLDDLEEAANQAIRILQTVCADVTPDNPAERLEMMERRITAMVEAAKVVLPAVEDFYETLSDEQKARYAHFGKKSGQ